MKLEDYFYVPFKAGGRGPDAYDCWGWGRSIRHEIYGKRLLPAHPGVDIDDRVAMTDVYRQLEVDDRYTVSENIQDAIPGTVVGVLVAGYCTHVGVVVEHEAQLYYADISRSGVRRMPLQEIEKLFRSKVYTLVYLNDND